MALWHLSSDNIFHSEFSTHKEQTQTIHQTAIGALHCSDRVEIWYPSCLSEGMGRHKPGNTWTVTRTIPLGWAPGRHDSSLWGIIGFIQTVSHKYIFLLQEVGRAIWKGNSWLKKKKIHQFLICENQDITMYSCRSFNPVQPYWVRNHFFSAQSWEQI